MISSAAMTSSHDDREPASSGGASGAYDARKESLDAAIALMPPGWSLVLSMEPHGSRAVLASPDYECLSWEAGDKPTHDVKGVQIVETADSAAEAVRGAVARIDPGHVATDNLHRRWQRMEAHIRALAALMCPGGVPASVEENLQANEFGLALEELVYAIDR